MKFAHISDLHLGKTLHGFSLIEDQKYALTQVLEICKKTEVQAILVAGDVFDHSVAPIEGIKLFEWFLHQAVSQKLLVFVISGNHDSGERLSFGTQFMIQNGLYFSKPYDGNIEPVVLQDEYGPVNVYLFPFIKPSIVSSALSNDSIKDYQDAVEKAISQMRINPKERNIIVSHQNILNAERSDSEEIIIGGVDGVSSALYEQFDYSALGHIHKPQTVGKNVRYCGSLLKYSVSELNNQKTVTIIELKQKGTVNLSYEPLKPLRDIRQIKGKFEQILSLAKTDQNNKDDFIDVILTDEDEVLDAIYSLRKIYPNILQLTYDNHNTRNNQDIQQLDSFSKADPFELFKEFYQNRRGTPLDNDQEEYIKDVIQDIWREKE